MQARVACRLARAVWPKAFPAILIATSLLFTFAPARAEAQSWAPSWVPPWALSYLKNFGAGVSVVRLIPVDGKLSPAAAVAASVGFAPQVGWGFVIGLGAFKADVRTSDVRVGYVRASPLMGGVGYTWLYDQWAVKSSAAVGIIFTDLAIDQNRLEDSTGQPATIQAGKRFGARLTFGVEYALAPKFGLRGVANYTPIYPSFVAKTTGGETRGSWNASNVSLQVAFVVYPLR